MCKIMDNQDSKFKPLFVSQEEEDMINDIRALEFGRILVNIQNSVIISKEITKTIRNFRKKNNVPNNNVPNNNIPNNDGLDDYN